MSVLKQTTFTALPSTGMLLCLITAGIDLSVGANRDILRMHARYDGQGGNMTNPVVLILVALITGTVIGPINGTLA